MTIRTASLISHNFNELRKTEKKEKNSPEVGKIKSGIGKNSGDLWTMGITLSVWGKGVFLVDNFKF